MKKSLSVILGGTLSMAMFVGCSSAPATSVTETTKEIPTTEVKAETAPVAKTDVTLSFMTNMVGVSGEVLEQVCKDFTAETGIQIEYSAPGSNYDELMKTKMASQDLPDLWSTHGWSVARYSEYLRPINDQPFAKDIVEAIKPIITNEKGEIFVLPVDVDLAGVIYNKDVLDKVGVNADDIKIWEDFEAACEKVKAAGITPIHIGGKDNWPLGQFTDWVAPSFFITNENKNFRQEFKDGNFDWKNWEELAGMLDKWNQAGYLNVDALTSDYLTGAKALGEGKVAFEFYGGSAIKEALTAFPNANIGIMPIPAKDASDTGTLIGGERLAIGVWKDSEHTEEALQFLNYLARPEIDAKIATANGNPAGLKGVESDTGKLKPYYEKLASIRTFPYFDRTYLPSGMWNDICTSNAKILSKQDNAIAEAAKQMETSYKDKFSQK